jgi:hypothetical protein
VKRALLAPLLAAFACSSTGSILPGGDFSGPSGLAVARLADRNLLFVANEGSNELRALMLCNSAAGAPTTCTPKEDFHFLPAPNRLFPASILVGERPLRLAGAPLVDAASVPHGAVLVAGSDAVLRVVDAANVLAASQDKTVTAEPPRVVPLPAAPVDVVATDVSGQVVTAIAVSQAPAGGNAALTVFRVTLDANGLAEATRTQRCALDFAPAKLALVGGRDDPQTRDDLLGDGRPRYVYVADGTVTGTAAQPIVAGGRGDGAVEVSVADIPPFVDDDANIPACGVTRRLPASDPADSPRRPRPLRSIALSPAFVATDGGPRVAGGTYLLGATLGTADLCGDAGVRACRADLRVDAGAVCADHGTPRCGAGALILLNTNVGGQSTVARAPPTPISASTGLPMAPLHPPTPAREVAFMGRDDCPAGQLPPCTLLRVGVGIASTPPTLRVPLIGLASTENGGTVFVKALDRTFFNELRDSGVAPDPLPSISTIGLVPQPAPGVPLTQLTFPDPAIDPNTQMPFPSQSLVGWMNAGVSRDASWRVVWHATIPGLESVSGSVSRTGSTIRLVLPGKDLNPWVAAPGIRLGPGDFVRAISFAAPPGTTLCADLQSPATSIDVPITAVRPGSPGSPAELDLQAVTGFDPSASCFVPGVGGTFEVHAGTTAAGPWMVFEGLDLLGRVPHGVQFVVTGPRFDYPLTNYSAPPPANDPVLAFTISGREPVPGQDPAGLFLGFSTFGGQLFPGTSREVITTVRDISNAGQPGFAGPILVYSSPREPDPIVFTALTGANGLQRSRPAQLGTADSAVVFY